MTQHINLVVEDDVHYNVIAKIIQSSSKSYEINRVYGRRGNDYIKKNIVGFNQASKITPFIILTDLDTVDCPVTLIKDWINFKKHANLIFRIAVKEAESWLISDLNNFADFMGVSKDAVDHYPEQIGDPKEYIVTLAKRSKKKNIREDIVPTGTAQIGKNYNSCIGDFIIKKWNVNNAKKTALSLQRFVKALDNFSFSKY